MNVHVPTPNLEHALGEVEAVEDRRIDHRRRVVGEVADQFSEDARAAAHVQHTHAGGVELATLTVRLG